MERSHRLRFSTAQPGVLRVPLAAAGLAAAAAFGVFVAEADTATSFSRPTYSSPIAMSADNKLVWSVNPADDSVSVIRTDTNTLVTNIQVGDEPQSVALDPNNQYAYVANAAGSGVTVIRIHNANPSKFEAEVDRRVGHRGQLSTGAEPWNIVASPDGRRVFVANSGQDTITVIDARNQEIIGNVDLRDSVCNDPDRNRRFQPRGLAVTQDNRRLYVTRFFSYTRAGGVQADDNGREGLVCRLDIDTHSKKTADYRPVSAVRLAAQVTGFKVDSNGDGVADDTSAYPNQLQSIVVRGNDAYLPNIAASPQGPQIFNVTNQSFVNRVSGVNGATQADAGALNLNLGAQNPEPPKLTLFFANPWAIAFTTQSGPGTAYAVSAASDLLVKLNVAATGELGFTVDGNTTRYIDLNDPDNPATQGVNAGKNPQGIVINDAGTTAYVANFVSRNVSVVNLAGDSVTQVIGATALAQPGSPQERVLVGAEMFFSSRGNFDRPPGTTVSTRNRLSQAGWQACATCHFKGWTDGVVWAFGTGARKSVPLNGSFNPHDRSQQRVFNYSAIFDEIEDFEGNIRDTSGPGQLAQAVSCDNGDGTSKFDPNHGLLVGAGDINTPPCVIDRFNPADANRPQLTVTLPNSNTAVPALTALKEWVQFAVRTPNGPLTNLQVKDGAPLGDIIAGRVLFKVAGCATCHGGQQWTSSVKDFISPPDPAGVFSEREAPFELNPIGTQYIDRFLRDIGSFNIGVPGGGNPLGNNIGGVEKTASAGVVVAAQDGLGRDYSLAGSRSFGKGKGFNPPSLLGIGLLPPYYHNGACETLACVVSDANHRKAGAVFPFGDILANHPRRQAQVVKFLESIDAETNPIKP